MGAAHQLLLDQSGTPHRCGHEVIKGVNVRDNAPPRRSIGFERCAQRVTCLGKDFLHNGGVETLLVAVVIEEKCDVDVGGFCDGVSPRPRQAMGCELAYCRVKETRTSSGVIGGLSRQLAS